MGGKTYKSATQRRKAQQSHLVGVDNMLMYAQGGENEGGKSCEKTEDVEQGDHFGDEGGGFHAVFDWIGQVEVGQKGWDTGYIDGLR